MHRKYGIQAPLRKNGYQVTRRNHVYVDTFNPLLHHDQWRNDLAANDGRPGQSGYGLMAWLVLHRGWYSWLNLPEQ